MRNKKYVSIIILLFAVIVVIVGVFVWQRNNFRLISTNTIDGVIANSSSFLELKFNKNLASNFDTSSDNISFDPAVKLVKVSSEDSSIFFTLNPDIPIDSITVNIKNVTAENGDTIVNLKRTFKIEYVKFNSLSKDEQTNQVNLSDSSEKSFPIVKILPIISSQYNINYRFPNEQFEDPNRLILIIDTLGVSSDPLFIEENLDYLTEIRQKALDDIRSRGYTPEDYTIVYEEDIPAND